MPVEGSFIYLSNSLMGPRTHKSLSGLSKNVETAGERQASLQSAKVYADVSAQAWDLQGTFSALQSARHTQEFYAQQRLLLETYSASLESMRQDLLEFTALVFSASEIIPGEKEGFLLVKPGVQRVAEGLINTLNTYDANYGYIFGGAQIDQRPINPGLIKDLGAQFGPALTLGNLQNYFVNGATPRDQSPLILYARSQNICTLPLRANDLQGAIQMLHDFLALPSDPSQEQIQFFHQAVNGPMDQVINAFSKVSSYLKAFDAEETVLYQLSTCYANWRDHQLEVDPLEAAIDFHECTRALQAFFDYLVFTVSIARKFHDSTARVMI